MLRLDIASPSDSRTVATDDVDREVEVAAHPADEEQLLGVLLAEPGRVAPRQVHELGDDGEHAVEVAGARLPLEHVAEPAEMRTPGSPRDRRQASARRRGRRRADGEVGVEGARVAREVPLGPNCRGLRKIVTTTWRWAWRAWWMRVA